MRSRHKIRTLGNSHWRTRVSCDQTSWTYSVARWIVARRARSEIEAPGMVEASTVVQMKARHVRGCGGEREESARNGVDTDKECEKLRYARPSVDFDLADRTMAF